MQKLLSRIPADQNSKGNQRVFTKHRNDWWEKQSTEMEQLSARGNSQAYYEAIKTVHGPQKSKKICKMFLKKDGLYTKSAQESLERVAKH